MTGIEDKSYAAYGDNPERCRRCARAKTICAVPRPKPMGRPPNVAYEAQDNMSTQPTEVKSPLDSLLSLTTTNCLSASSPQPNLLEFLNFLHELTFGVSLTPNYGSTSFDVEGPSTGLSVDVGPLARSEFLEMYQSAKLECHSQTLGQWATPRQIAQTSISSV
ncbi:hypothetical protein BDV38DRAFT_277176 [Aspergillus pseudotamarii]|uniref:Uncharacterized protein n=1 Tax=Aspergillus pseudotamarii TaxID=132259 RepID=A0A5N6TAE4_ASPPS|nr:uncharacterized protein BDV38DRAFT_277176 [Aspergillus pseudotamarii]KAE8143149.1 hypothetical protein BDV38DRAFT_277176 [Aspergillus pseudotamarii]